MFKHAKLAVGLGMALGMTSVMAGTISYGLWDPNQVEATKTIIAEFEKQNPGIKVNIEQTPFKQYWVKAEAAATGGVAPDVMWMNFVNIQLYAKNGMLEPLDPYLAKSKIKLGDFVQSSVKAFSFQGKQYGIPRDIDSVAVWYNKKLFDEAGVKYPTNNWTWNDMIAAAKTIKGKSTGKMYPVFIDLLDGGQESYYNIIPGNGGYIISADKKKLGIDEPASIDALKKIQSAMKDGLIPTAQELSAIKGDELFQSGKVAMFWGGAWWAKPLSENTLINKQIGIVEMPAMKKKMAVAHSLANVVSANSKNKADAWKLVEFMGGDWAQSVLAKTRTVIPARLSVQGEWAKSFQVDASAYTNAFKYSYQYPFSLYTAKWDKTMRQGLERVWQGEDPASALPPVVKQVNRILASE